MAIGRNSGKAVSTTETSIALLEHLKERDGATLEEIAEGVGIAQSTAHRHLQTLLTHGFVERTNRQYKVGLRFLDFGKYAQEAHELYDVGKEEVTLLARECGEKVRLTAYENGMSVLLYKSMGNYNLQTDTRIGQHQHLHYLAAGKAILAHLPPEEVDDIIDRYGLPEETPHTITDADELRQNLEEIREQGYGFNREELYEGLHAVGAPVLDENGRPIGALSISGPARRLKGEYFHDELPEMLQASTNEVEINLRYS